MPRNPTIRIPKYRLRKPSGLGVVRLNGRDIYLGKHGSADGRAEYQRVIAEWIAAGGGFDTSCAPGHAKVASAIKSDVSIDELTLAYLEFAKTYYVKNGLQTDEEVVCIREALKPLVVLFGRQLAGDFRPLRFKAVRLAMIEKDWCRSYVNGQINRIRRAFK